MHARPCPQGYFAPKHRTKRCLPCPKGNYCPFEGMAEPIMCPLGHVCDRPKLTSPRAECPAGYWCQLGTQGNDPFFNGLIGNHTHHCEVGTYCRGGMRDNEIREPDDYEAVATECLPGMVCHQGSTLTVGSGECPAGYYCPHRNHTGIECPTRHYCPGRGNIEPLPCPKGTFNMWTG